MSGCNDCVWKFFDFNLCSEWCKTVREYLPYLKNPFREVAPMDLLKLNHAGDIGFSAWSSLQFYGSIVYALLTMVLSIILTGVFAGSFIVNFILAVAMGWIISHLAWFSIVKRPDSTPCCCLIFCCVSCKCVPLAWAIICWVLGVLMVIMPLGNMGLCGACFLLILPPLLYAPILVYLGISAFKIWNEQKAEIVGQGVVVKGPEGQTVGQVAAEQKDLEAANENMSTVQPVGKSTE